MFSCLLQESLAKERKQKRQFPHLRQLVKSKVKKKLVSSSIKINIKTEVSVTMMPQVDLFEDRHILTITYY